MRQFLLLLFLAAASSASVEIEWLECPAGQDGTDCASITLPLDPDDATNSETVSAFVRRFYAGEAATNKSLWMFAGGPGDTAESFAGGAEYFNSYDPTVTVYLMDQRGVGMSSPSVNCANPPLYDFDPNNQTTVGSYSACNAEIAETYGAKLKYFGTYYAAVDYMTVVNMVNADKVAIYALSFGTYALNTYLQLPGARADVVVMDGPVPPNRWALERDPVVKSDVAMVRRLAQTHKRTPVVKSGVVVARRLTHMHARRPERAGALMFSSPAAF
jgi:pimeloyl-ACP methyl ester carboxylesterase